MPERIKIIRYNLPWSNGVKLYNKEKLRIMSTKDLYQLHGQLHKKQISSFIEKTKTQNHQEYAVGSFVVSVVQETDPIYIIPENRKKHLIIPKNEPYLEIHFVPLNKLKPSLSRITRLETMCLGLADTEKLFETIENLVKQNRTRYITGSTNKEMAYLAKLFGFSVSKPYVTFLSFKDFLTDKNDSAYNVFIDNIPKFIKHGRLLLKKIKAKAEPTFDKYNITEQNARINAILRFAGKGIEIFLE